MSDGYTPIGKFKNCIFISPAASERPFLCRLGVPTLEVPVATDCQVLPCRLPADEADRVRQLAAKRDVYVTQVIREALAREVGFPVDRPIA